MPRQACRPSTSCKRNLLCQRCRRCVLHCLCNMPIKKELRRFYAKTWRTVTRPRILARAEGCCERCGKPNHARVATASGKDCYGHYWMVWAKVEDFEDLATDPVFLNQTGEPSGMIRTDAPFRRIRVVLTVAHLNHVAGDDRDENLAALCQWCHLIHDRDHHKQTRETRKDGARPLLVSDPGNEPTPPEGRPR